MRRTIYLPDELSGQIEAYMKEHPGESLSNLVRAALVERLAPSDPAAILELAGLVPEASTSARAWAEDDVARRER